MNRGRDPGTDSISGALRSEDSARAANPPGPALPVRFDTSSEEDRATGSALGAHVQPLREAADEPHSEPSSVASPLSDRKNWPAAAVVDVSLRCELGAWQRHDALAGRLAG